MDRIKNIRVRDVMTRGVITVSHDTPVKKIAEILVGEGISGIAVVSPGGDIMGVISEIDIIGVFADNWDKLTAEDIMSSNVRTVEPCSTIAEAAQIMKDLRVHRLLILHKVPGHNYDIPVGIICASDIMKSIVGLK